MKPSWFFETDIFSGSGVSRLVAEVRRQGMEAKIAAYEPFASGETYRDLFPPHACVVFVGSLGFAQQARRETTWVPGPMFDREAYRCSRYYPALGRFLLAQSYAMAPFGDLPRQADFLFDVLGEENTLFLRPDSGTKPFTGQLISRETLERDLDLLSPAGTTESSTLVVVSPPRNIEVEWRFVAVDDQVITGSFYRAFGSRYRHRCSRFQEPEAWALATAVAASGYRPDRAWTIDICQTTSGSYYLLEINSFACAGLYDCDPGPVVREVSRVALEEWELANGIR